MVSQPINAHIVARLRSQLKTVADDAATFKNAKNERNHAAVTATHGRPSLVEVAKIFGALFCTASPYKIRDAVNMNVFAAEKAAVSNTALTIEGRTLTPAL